MTQWCESKFLAWENQNGICPICNARIYLNERCFQRRMVGHHKLSRQYGDDSVENCEARHADCEVWAHKNWRDGNPK